MCLAHKRFYSVVSVIVYVLCFQDYIARFGHGSAKLAKQAQSKEKVLAKMVSAGLTEKVVADKVVSTYVVVDRLHAIY